MHLYVKLYIMAYRKRPNPTINSGSMADIAFLLLVFFMVVTSIQREKSISMKLPPRYEGQAGAVNENRVLSILINGKNQIMIEGKLTSNDIIDRIKIELNRMVEANKKPYVSIKIHEGSQFETYVQLLSKVKKAIMDIKKDYSELMYNSPLESISQSQYDKINQRLSIKISESQFATS